jgi:hypothetical protein
MSHYSVIVIGEGYEDQLAPYNTKRKTWWDWPGRRRWMGYFAGNKATKYPDDTWSATRVQQPTEAWMVDH